MIGSDVWIRSLPHINSHIFKVKKNKNKYLIRSSSRFLCNHLVTKF